MNAKRRGLGIALAGLTVLSAGLLAASPASADEAPAPDAPAFEGPPPGCVLSDTHLLYDGRQPAASNRFASSTGGSDPSVPTDPENPQQYLRSGAFVYTNLTHHVFYDPSIFILSFAVAQHSSLVPLDFDPETMTFRAPADAVWDAGWEPITGTLEVKYRDTDTPVVAIDTSSFELEGAGSRPGVELSDIGPGLVGTAKYEFSTTHTVFGNDRAYGTRRPAALAGKTCLPVPTVQPVTDSTALAISGTGTTEGDVVTVRDDLGNALGTATVQADLTWKVDLAAPVDANAQKLVVVATDIFGFTGTAETGLLGSVTWTKASSETSALLNGSAWTLTGPEGFELELVDGGQRDANAEAGKLGVTSLKLGKYVLTEAVAPKGFVLSTEKFEFEVDSNNWVIDLGQILNDPVKAVDPETPGGSETPGTPGDPKGPAKPADSVNRVSTGGIAHTGAGSMGLVGFSAAGLLVTGLGVTYLVSRRRTRVSG